jgi:glycosyltransferase involved in cell wall biosynthesis
MTTVVLPKPRIAIIVPCYNEQEVLPLSIPILLDILDKMSSQGLAAVDSFILCCNDGSRDCTWQLIEEMHRQDNRIKGISLAHNRGQQSVMLAGLMTVRDISDAAITIDADLQDDPNAIIEMVKLFVQGKDIVYGVRSSRETDTWFKRTSARAFYKFQKAMGLETIYDHSEYRLMSSRALGLLSEYSESNLFLRGIMMSIGLETAVVTYPRAKRLAGDTKYSFGKLLGLSIDGITSFTAKPMRIIFMIGLVLLLIDVFVAVWVFLSYFKQQAISGWSSIMLSIWFLGSLILMALGIVGEYIGKIYIEVKHRPRYAIKDSLLD